MIILQQNWKSVLSISSICKRHNCKQKNVYHNIADDCGISNINENHVNRYGKYEL